MIVDSPGLRDPDRVTAQLDSEGHAVLPGLLAGDAIPELGSALLELAGESQAERLEALGLGNGCQWRLPRLPEPLQAWRSAACEQLAPIAGRWNDLMGMPPATWPLTPAYFRPNADTGQDAGKSFLTRLRNGDYQALQQNAGARDSFPLQLMILLSEPGIDFTGGEFVMTEQRPRMQSRPMVARLRKGDGVLFAVSRRPHKGSKGFYRVNLRHAVSRVRSGERWALEILFPALAPEPDGAPQADVEGGRQARLPIFAAASPE